MNTPIKNAQGFQSGLTQEDRLELTPKPGQLVYQEDEVVGWYWYNPVLTDWVFLGGSGIQSIVPGNEFLIVDPTDPANPIVTAAQTLDNVLFNGNTSGNAIILQFGSYTVEMNPIDGYNRVSDGVFTSLQKPEHFRVQDGDGLTTFFGARQVQVQGDYTFTQNFPDLSTDNATWNHRDEDGTFTYLSEERADTLYEPIGGSSGINAVTGTPNEVDVTPDGTGGVVVGLPDDVVISNSLGVGAGGLLVVGTISVDENIEAQGTIAASNFSGSSSGTNTGDNAVNSSSDPAGSAAAAQSAAQAYADGIVAPKVTGPASATDNAIARFDATTGKLIQNSPVSISDAGEIILPSVASPTYAQGKVAYDSDNECLTFFNNDVNVGMQIGQENWIRVRNDTGSTIPNGAAVYISGTHASGLPQITLAKADSAATVICAGLATESIANNAIGYVTNLGKVNGLDTSGFAAGASLFVSATTAGALTTTAPLAPNYRFRVGIVTKSNASTGTITVTPSTGALGNGTAGQVLGINASGSQEWQNGSFVFKNGVAGSAVAVTATEQILSTQLVPLNRTAAGSIIEAKIWVTRTGTASGATLRLYWNTTPDLTGSPTAVQSFIIGNTILSAPFVREGVIAAGNKFRYNNVAASPSNKDITSTLTFLERDFTPTVNMYAVWTIVATSTNGDAFTPQFVSVSGTK